MMKSPKIVAFIPARGGSKSIPLKNIKPLNGRPLIYWAIDAAVNSKFIDLVFVATDHPDIEQAVQQYGSKKVRVVGRSAETATDSASTESAMFEFAQNNSFDYIVLIQATSPLLETEYIEQGLCKIISTQADSVISLVRQKRFIWESFGEEVRPLNYIPEKRPRRQEFEGCLVENGAFYITSRERLLSTGCRISGRIIGVEMPKETFIELDEPSDWVIIEQILKERETGKEQLSVKIKKVKMILTDCDGVLTDGGMYYSENGDELKKFNTRDGMAVEILKELGISVGIITKESRNLVQARAKKLGIDVLYMGVNDKLSVFDNIKSNYGLVNEEIAYIGDDINDLEIIRVVGLGIVPSDGMELVKATGHYITKAKGGEGVLREVAELFLKFAS